MLQESILQYFRPSFSYHLSLRPSLYLFLIGRLRQVLLYNVIKTKVIGPWLSGRLLESRPKDRGFEPHRRHCVVPLSKNINASLVLVQPGKARPIIIERLLMGRKESNQKNKGNTYLEKSF